MRILLTADPMLPVPPTLYGGIERIVAGLAEELRLRGIEVGLIAHRDSRAPVDRLFAWTTTEARGVKAGARNSYTLLQAVGAFRPHLVHSFSRLGYLLPILAFRVPKLMSYQRLTGGRQISLAAALGGSTLRFSGCSEFIAAMGRRWGGKWLAIPNFVDTNQFRYVPAVADKAPLVFLGRIERIKGAHLAIAIAKLAGRELIIAGNRSREGAEADYWEREIAPELGRNGISYVGPVDDKQKIELLGQALALVAPIEWDEPFGIVFVEALACGTPVISRPRGAAPEIVRDGIEGFLVPDVAAGCKAVREIGLISRSACRRRAVEEYSRAVVVDRYLEAYEELL